MKVEFHRVGDVRLEPAASGQSLPGDDDRSIAELTKDLLRNVSELVAESSTSRRPSWPRRVDASRSGWPRGRRRRAPRCVVGALIATAILALATTLDTWLAALIVTIVPP